MKEGGTSQTVVWQCFLYLWTSMTKGHIFPFSASQLQLPCFQHAKGYGIWCPLVEAFHETTDMCIWEIYLILRTTVGGSQVKHTPCNNALNWQPERQIMSLRYFWWMESLKSAWENSGISYRPHLLLFCVIFLYYILIHRPVISFPTCHYSSPNT